MDFLDYAMLQQWIDEHDKYNRTLDRSLTEDERAIAELRCDLRNTIQGQIELYVFRMDRPAVGERYGAYLSDSHPDIVTTWMGDPLMKVTAHGATWRRWGKFGRVTYHTVYARDESGALYRGIQNSNDDLVIFRRTK